MKLYSTNKTSRLYSFEEAVLIGLAPDGGLFMPAALPKFSFDYFKQIHKKSFAELCNDIAQVLLRDEIPSKTIQSIVEDAFDFEVPLIELEANVHSLELFHGPSLAFKDFGARFMSRVMSFFNRNEDTELWILVATSGDTGGAVASGFHKIPGIRVVIMYPRDGVSPLQEKQITTFGDNITALSIDGTFDDCQYLVKKLLDDKVLRRNMRLSSANSINIARLLPQSFYYFEIFRTHTPQSKIAVSIPSGNFGNLTAGLFAREMGAPIRQIIAATNVNDVVPQYLMTGHYTPKPSKSTLSNAMDVGDPSNFGRILSLFGSTWNTVRQNMDGLSFTDDLTKKAIESVYNKHNYILDPHGAIGYLALKTFLSQTPHFKGVFLETAHPAKFHHIYNDEMKERIEFPDSLIDIQDKPSYSVPLSNQLDEIRSFFLDITE